MREDLEDRLFELARRFLEPGELPEMLLAIADDIDARLGECREALLLYGSHLPPADSGATIAYDLLALVTSYADAFPRKRMLRWMSRLFTPDLWFGTTGGFTARALVILATYFDRATDARGGDLEILARLGRRLFLVRARDEAVVRRVAHGQARALALL